MVEEARSEALRNLLPAMSDEEELRKPTRTRKTVSKRLISDDESDTEALNERATVPQKVPTGEVTSLFDDDVQVNIDEHESSEMTSSALAASAKRKKKANSSSRQQDSGVDRRAAKRAKLAQEEDDDYISDAADEEMLDLADGNGDDDDDDDFIDVEDTKPKRKSGKAGAVSRGGTKNVKPKAKPGSSKEKEKEIVIRDERKKPSLGPRPSKVVAVEGTGEAPPTPGPSSSAPSINFPAPALGTGAAPSSAPPKKKLPNIKKYNTSSGPSTPSGQATTKSNPGRDLGQKIPPLPSTSGSAQRQASQKKGQDMDLSNPDVYAELMRSSAGSGGRAGVKGKEQIAARKQELERMREEDKIRREAQAQHHTFDLQEQLECLSTYEEELLEGNLELHPHSLAVRWFVDYDMKLREAEEASKEEGEM